MNCCASVGAKQWPGLLGNFVDDMHLAYNVTNFVQYIMAHDIN